MTYASKRLSVECMGFYCTVVCTYYVHACVSCRCMHVKGSVATRHHKTVVFTYIVPAAATYCILYDCVQ